MVAIGVGRILSKIIACSSLLASEYGSPWQAPQGLSFSMCWLYVVACMLRVHLGSIDEISLSARVAKHSVFRQPDRRLIKSMSSCLS